MATVKMPIVSQGHPGQICVLRKSVIFFHLQGFHIFHIVVNNSKNYQQLNSNIKALPQIRGVAIGGYTFHPVFYFKSCASCWKKRLLAT